MLRLAATSACPAKALATFMPQIGLSRPPLHAACLPSPPPPACRRSQRDQAGRLACRAAQATSAATSAPVFHYMEIKLETKPGIHIIDITPQARGAC